LIEVAAAAGDWQIARVARVAAQRKQFAAG